MGRRESPNTRIPLGMPKVAVPQLPSKHFQDNLGWQSQPSALSTGSFSFLSPNRAQTHAPPMRQRAHSDITDLLHHGYVGRRHDFIDAVDDELTGLSPAEIERRLDGVVSALVYSDKARGELIKQLFSHYKGHILEAGVACVILRSYAESIHMHGSSALETALLVVHDAARKLPWRAVGIDKEALNDLRKSSDQIGQGPFQLAEELAVTSLLSTISKPMAEYFATAPCKKDTDASGMEGADRLLSGKLLQTADQDHKRMALSNSVIGAVPTSYPVFEEKDSEDSGDEDEDEDAAALGHSSVVTAAHSLQDDVVKVAKPVMSEPMGSIPASKDPVQGDLVAPVTAPVERDLGDDEDDADDNGDEPSVDAVNSATPSSLPYLSSVQLDDFFSGYFPNEEDFFTPPTNQSSSL